MPWQGIARGFESRLPLQIFVLVNTQKPASQLAFFISGSPMAVSVQELTKALESLRIALESPYSDIVRDASIQRFEFCIELSWRTLKKKMGSSSVAPKAVLREAAAQGLVANLDIWFDFIEARNLTSLIYNEDVAKRVFETVKHFYPEALKLLTKLNSI